ASAQLENLVPLASVPATGLVVKDEGASFLNLVGTLNFTGSAATATETSPGLATINITGGGSGTVNAGVAKRVALYPSSTTAVDDAAGIEYQASGSPMVLLDGQTATDPVLVVRESTASSTVPLVGGFPAIATIQTTNINNFWNMAYVNDAATS